MGKGGATNTAYDIRGEGKPRNDVFTDKSVGEIAAPLDLYVVGRDDNGAVAKAGDTTRWPGFSGESAQQLDSIQANRAVAHVNVVASPVPFVLFALAVAALTATATMIRARVAFWRPLSTAVMDEAQAGEVLQDVRSRLVLDLLVT